MFSRADRKELSVLGLLVLAWGLLVAPLAHLSAHHHAHTHGVPAQGTPHGDGSVEHLLACATESPAAVDPVFVGVPLTRVAALAPERLVVDEWEPVEEPQGP